MNFNERAFIIGMIGDFILQIIVKYHPNGDFAGLKSYFQQHGSFESMFIAGGMLYFFSFLLDVFGIEKNIINLSIYATILDVLFRIFRLFPSLDGYYHALNPFLSIIWSIIPLNLPLFIKF